MSPTAYFICAAMTAAAIVHNFRRKYPEALRPVLDEEPLLRGLFIVMVSMMWPAVLVVLAAHALGRAAESKGGGE